MTREQAQPTEFDAVVVGAGFAGLYSLHRLRALGLAVRGLEAADGVGGTWYWNRYPGARCDVESMRLLVLVLRRARAGMGVDASATRRSRRSCATSTTSPTASTCAATSSFDTRVTAAALRRGRRPLGGHDRPRRPCRRRASASWRRAACRRRSVPDFPGLRRLQGRRAYHTGRWPHEGVDFTGQRVGVIGTGSSGIQSIPLIAEQAAHLTVFQRTPNFSVPAQQRAARPRGRARASRPTTPSSAQRGARDRDRRPRVDATRSSALEVARGGARARRTRRRWEQGGLALRSRLTPICSSTSAANDTAAEFVRAQDPRASSATRRSPSCSAPTDHPLGTKRLCVDTDYYDDLQPRQRHARRPAHDADRGDHARRACAPRTPSTRSTRSCSPPASTP